MGVLALHLSDREKGWWLLFALIVQGFASWFCPSVGEQNSVWGLLEIAK